MIELFRHVALDSSSLVESIKVEVLIDFLIMALYWFQLVFLTFLVRTGSKWLLMQNEIALWSDLSVMSVTDQSAMNSSIVSLMIVRSMFDRGELMLAQSAHLVGSLTLLAVLRL